MKTVISFLNNLHYVNDSIVAIHSPSSILVDGDLPARRRQQVHRRHCQTHRRQVSFITKVDMANLWCLGVKYYHLVILWIEDVTAVYGLHRIGGYLVRLHRAAEQEE